MFQFSLGLGNILKSRTIDEQGHKSVARAELGKLIIVGYALFLFLIEQGLDFVHSQPGCVVDVVGLAALLPSDWSEYEEIVVEGQQAVSVEYAVIEVAVLVRLRADVFLGQQVEEVLQVVLIAHAAHKGIIIGKGFGYEEEHGFRQVEACHAGVFPQFQDLFACLCAHVIVFQELLQCGGGFFLVAHVGLVGEILHIEAHHDDGILGNEARGVGRAGAGAEQCCHKGQQQQRLFDFA